MNYNPYNYKLDREREEILKGKETKNEEEYLTAGEKEDAFLSGVVAVCIVLALVIIFGAAFFNNPIMKP